jgi:hypothetical protein
MKNTRFLIVLAWHWICDSIISYYSVNFFLNSANGTGYSLQNLWWHFSHDIYRLQKSTSNKHPLLNRKHRVFIKKMVCRTEGVQWRKPSLGKRTKCFILLEKHKNFTWTIWPQDTLRFHIVCKHYQQRAMAPMTWQTDRQTLRHCDLEQASGGGTPGVWKNNLRDGIQCFYFHCFIPNKSYITNIHHPTILLWKLLFS